MIHKLLEEVSRYVPCSWPLQNFAAINPLFDLIEQSFEDALHDIARFSPINGSQQAHSYHKNYRLGNINPHDLELALIKFSAAKNIPAEWNNRLLQLLIDKPFQHDFEQLLAHEDKYGSTLISSVYENKANFIDSQRLVVKISDFLAAFLDLGQAKLALPIKNTELLAAWKEYAELSDEGLAKLIRLLPSETEASIEYLLNFLNIPPHFYKEYLLEILFKLLGWASLIKWLQRHPENLYFKKSAALASFLVIWLCHEAALRPKIRFQANTAPTHLKINHKLQQLILKHIAKAELIKPYLKLFSKHNVNLIWQSAFEINYQNNLSRQLRNNPSIENASLTEAQAIFCIDVRSEGIRRNLENNSKIETFGFAGFFGIGFQFDDHEHHQSSWQSPFLIQSKHKLAAKVTPPGFWQSVSSILKQAFSRSKRAWYAPVILFDIIGLFYSLILSYKTFKLGDFQHLKANSLALEINVFAGNPGFTPTELAQIISDAFNTIGILKAPMSELVFIVAHKSEGENNPYQASLNCGACGGNSGVPNAIAFCQAVNTPAVREELHLRHQIEVPATTFFVAACHNTANDEIIYLNEALIPALSIAKFKKVKQHFAAASKDLQHEKQIELAELSPQRRNQSAWAELMPELGQLNNSALIIAPRALSQGVNLKRRTFLHSYDPSVDLDGSILTSLFAAPVIICHWINSQYYFSSTDPKLYAAGNKALQNIIGRFAVQEGNFSDLKIGLPLQSISYQNEIIHEALRLLVVVYAPRQIVEIALKNNPQTAALFGGSWANLEIIEPEPYE